jgi:hypothetical protein
LCIDLIREPHFKEKNYPDQHFSFADKKWATVGAKYKFESQSVA